MSILSHKFFERFLDNDLDQLYVYLEQKQEELLSGKLVEIPEEKLKQYNKGNGGVTQLGSYYNIFSFDNLSILELQKSINSMVKEACDYYGIDFDSQEYMINGWYNVDYKVEIAGVVSPLKNSDHYHDHMGGEGAPVFHGYYCVNAEPSITYYKIGGINGVPFENINKNNRAIISETGHPHGRDDWHQNKPRITIAYDVCPLKNGVGPHWINL